MLIKMNLESISITYKKTQYHVAQRFSQSGTFTKTTMRSFENVII